MFIHWGLYAVPAGEWKGQKIPGMGEWILFDAKIPFKEYEALQKKFNPTKFDADKWARIAKNAGMGYVVLTTKHIDGFCMFDSKLTDYDVMGTPFKRDVMKELSKAVRGQRHEDVYVLFRHGFSPSRLHAHRSRHHVVEASRAARRYQPLSGVPERPTPRAVDELRPHRRHLVRRLLRLLSGVHSRRRIDEDDARHPARPHRQQPSGHRRRISKLRNKAFPPRASPAATGKPA